MVDEGYETVTGDVLWVAVEVEFRHVADFRRKQQYLQVLWRWLLWGVRSRYHASCMTHPFAETVTAPFVTVGRVEDWQDGQAREVKVHKKPMTVVRLGEAFFAVNSICPHMGGPLSCGAVKEGHVTCPWHDWAFDVKTGESPNGHQITCYETRVTDGEVQVGWVKK